jgi:phospholipid/cholesterol/gamma-HCH transport system substrate-binding protein
MKLKTEVKIGFIVLATIVLVIYGINFLKGRNVLRRTDVFYAVFNDVGGLGLSSAVYISGLKTGLVNDISFKQGSLNELVVAFTCDHRYTVPKGSVVELFSSDVLGTKALRLLPSASKEIHSFGDTLVSRIQMDMITKIENQLDPIQERIQAVFERADTLLASINNMLDAEMILNLQQTAKNLNETSRQVSSEKIGKILTEMQKFSSMLAQNREVLANAIQNLNSVSDSLAQSNLKQTMLSVEETFSRSAEFLEGINSGEGTIGKLATNDSLYINLNAATKNLEVLLEDLNQNPKRYVHFSLFGKKDK